MLYKCSDCAATVTACRHRVSVGDSLREARTQAVEAGLAPPEVTWLKERFQEHGSPYSQNLREALPQPAAPGGALGVFPACSGLVHLPDELPAALSALKGAGESPGIALPDPPCCGYPLDTAGQAEAFRDQAERVAASLQGFQRIVALGAGCAHTLAVRYREIGVALTPKVTPLVDLLAERTEQLRARRKQDPPPSYAYHDPCFLARRLGRVDEPREVLRAVLGGPPLELGYSREASLCSGGGGVYPLTHPQAAKTCASNALELFQETGAELLVTGCPSAARRFRQANPDLDVRTLASVVAERLPP